MDKTERIALVSRTNPRISVKRQSELLSINRTSVYRPKAEDHIYHGESEENLDYMRMIDVIHLKWPAWGTRKITQYLKSQGYLVNVKRIRRLMQVMDIIALYPGPNLSKRYHAQYKRPYLLRNLAIERVDQVWGIDITYLPLRKGFMYLFIIIDWYSRQIVDFAMSYSLEKSFVTTCLKRALSQRKPEIINSDQGSHFTNPDYLQLMKEQGVSVSMDGKGQALDNVRTERFFRSLKYEDIYIKEYLFPKDMIMGVEQYIHDYNSIRPHQSLNGQRPNDFCKYPSTYQAA